MKILIAGLGSVGRRHLRNLLALGQQDIVLYRTHQSTLPDDELAGLPVYTNLDEALSVRPDAAIVANPTALHMKVAIPAARAGCHILLEKPVSHSLEDLAELKTALQHSGARLLVGYQFRFHPGLQKVAGLLSENVIGRPLAARAHWGEYLPDWHPWEDYRLGYTARADLGGGVILTLSHPLDYLRWLLGEVAAVWAYTSCQSELQITVEDTAEIGMQFENGVLGSVHLDYNQRPPAHHLEIIGTQGTLRWDNADGDIRLFRACSSVGWEIFPAPEKFERNLLFLAEMRHFLDVISGEIPPACSLEDGIQALQLATSALQSAQSKKMVEINPLW
jgi:predicted dehydrogenase